MKEMLKCIFSRLSYRYTTRPVVAMLTFAMWVVGATMLVQPTMLAQPSRAVPALQEPQWTDSGGYVMECLRGVLAIIGLDIR